MRSYILERLHNLCTRCYGAYPALGAGGLIFLAASAADNYLVDRDGNSVAFAVRYLGISRLDGAFDSVTGRLSLGPDSRPESLQLSIAAASLDTGDPSTDSFVEGPAFLDAAHHPDIEFASDRVEEADNGFVAHGILQMAGVRHPLSVPLQLTGPRRFGNGPTRLRLESSFRMEGEDLRQLVVRVTRGARPLRGTDVVVELQIQLTREE